jgi:hypothetical protein
VRRRNSVVGMSLNGNDISTYKRSRLPYALVLFSYHHSCTVQRRPPDSLAPCHSSFPLLSVVTLSINSSRQQINHGHNNTVPTLPSCGPPASTVVEKMVGSYTWGCHKSQTTSRCVVLSSFELSYRNNYTFTLLQVSQPPPQSTSPLATGTAHPSICYTYE